MCSINRAVLGKGRITVFTPCYIAEPSSAGVDSIMGWLGKLFGAKEIADAAGSVITSVSSGVTNLATGIRSAITGELSPEKRAELERIALEAENLQKHTQLEINLAEAQHQSVFVAGWRPFIGCESQPVFSLVR